ncbi:MAG: energy transducer TonB, partial [Bacteroidales bacterium]
MEVKKSSRANLDKNTTTNFLMGLVIALGFLFIGFEYSNTEVTVQDISDSSGEIEEEMMIEITRQYIPPPPPPPQTVQTDLIQIVEDNTLEEEVEFESMEDIPDEAVVITSSGDISEEYDPDGEVFMFVEEMPGFPGGDRALMEFINKNLRYPQLALENGISGRVICTFVIDGRGKVSDIQV